MMTCMRRRRAGWTLLELLAAVVLLAIAAAGAAAAWSISSRAPANKRATDMSLYLAIQEMERLKAEKYLSLQVTSPGSPIVTFFNRSGAPIASAVAGGYNVKSSVSVVVDRDGKSNSEDLLEVVVEVWNGANTVRHERLQTLMSFGGF